VNVRDTGAVDATFPRARKNQLGYKTTEVEDFFQRARRAYDGRPDRDAPALDAEHIRLTAFSMQKGGFSTAHVDAAMERLEDAFAYRERQIASRLHGDDAWLAEARTTAQVVANRLARPEGERFAERLTRYFRDGWPIAIDDVRGVVFTAQRGGYRESQVDLVLDAVVDVMLAVR
jgi:DivIVA domain-containing protein